MNWRLVRRGLGCRRRRVKQAVERLRHAHGGCRRLYGWLRWLDVVERF
jgi:hypothetical protein